jgi:hypothetical protein
MEVVAGTLTSAVTKKLIETIWNLLKKEKPSPNELRKLRETLTELINLSSNTGLAIGRYILLLRYSNSAGVHSTEFQSLSKVVTKEAAKQQFTKLRKVRIQKDLLKEGIEKIHSYRDDYEKAKAYYDNAEWHLLKAEQQFEADNHSSCNDEMEYLNKELDNLVILANRRIEELLEALRETYKALEEIED